jgi:hypothetical protein
VHELIPVNSADFFSYVRNPNTPEKGHVYDISRKSTADKLLIVGDIMK